MPQADISDWDLHSKSRRGDYGPVIDGTATDITGREDIDLDAVDLASEPEFPKDKATFRDETSERRASNPLMMLQGPLRKVDATKIHTKWRLIQQLTNTLPLNEYDLPVFVYRADMLDHKSIQELMLNLKRTDSPPSQSDEATTTPTSLPPVQRATPGNSMPTGSQIDLQRMLDAAMVPLEYPEGFPTYNNLPFWKQLDFETQNAYDAFFAYMEMGSKRTIADLIAYPPGDVLEWFHTYYWGIRVRAFELYRTAYLNKQRVLRMLDTEDSHYNQSQKLLDKIKPIFESFTADELKEVGFAKLVDAFEKLAKVQRISVGLPANGGPLPDESRTAPTVQVISAQIVQNSPDSRQETAEDINILEGSTEFIEDAQDLILKYQGMQETDK